MPGPLRDVVQKIGLDASGYDAGTARIIEDNRAIIASISDVIKKVSELQGVLGSLPDKRVNVEVAGVDEAIRKVGELKAAMDGLGDKTVTVTTRYVTVGDAPGTATSPAPSPPGMSYIGDPGGVGDLPRGATAGDAALARAAAGWLASGRGDAASAGAAAGAAAADRVTRPYTAAAERAAAALAAAGAGPVLRLMLPPSGRGPLLLPVGAAGLLLPARQPVPPRAVAVVAAGSVPLLSAARLGSRPIRSSGSSKGGRVLPTG